MKIFHTLSVSLALLVMAVAPSSIAGRWQGDLDGKPAVILNVTMDQGKLGGAVTFNVLRKEGDKTTVVEGQAVPLVNPKLNGKIFIFDIKDPNDVSGKEMLNFQMTLTGDDEGTLKNLDPDTPSPEIKMIRKAAETGTTPVPK